MPRTEKRKNATNFEDPEVIEKNIGEDIKVANYLPWNIEARPFPDEKTEERGWEERYADHSEYTRYIRNGDRREPRTNAPAVDPQEQYYKFMLVRSILVELVKISNDRDRGFVDGMARSAFRTHSVISTWHDGHTIRIEHWDWPYWYDGLDVRRFRQCKKANCRKYFWAKPLDKKFCSPSCQKAHGQKLARDRK